MSKPYTITGLDIGTSSIKGLCALKKQDSPSLEVLAQVSEPVLGMRKGVVINVEEVSKSISRARDLLQEKIGQKIDEVYVNINGGHIFTTPSHGSVVVSRADQKISQEDIDRVIQSAQAFSLPLNKEILDIFPKEFILDNERGIKEAVGMEGIRLEVEILALCAFSPYLKNLTNAVLGADIQIADIIPSPLASARAVLTPRQKELGVCLVDIGAGATGLAVYKEGNLIHAAVLPVGSSHITQDIAIGLRTDINIAEQIKREFGDCILEDSKINKGKEIKIELPQESSSLTFSQKMLVEVIGSRVSEIFDLIQKELKKISPSCLLPVGAVLAGNGAKLPGIVGFAKKELKLPVRLGAPWVRSSPKEGLDQPEWSGLEEDPGLAAVCGLVLKGKDLEEEDQKFSFDKKGILARIKKIFKVFIP